MSKIRDNVLLIFYSPGICPTPSLVDIPVSDDSPAFSSTMYNIIFTWVETRAISELRVRLVPFNMLKLSRFSFTDIFKAVHELIVYQSLRHPSVLPQFQTSSSLKPLGQLNSNFIWRLLRTQERKFVQMVLVEMAAMPIYS